MEKEPTQLKEQKSQDFIIQKVGDQKRVGYFENYRKGKLGFVAIEIQNLEGPATNVYEISGNDLELIVHFRWVYQDRHGKQLNEQVSKLLTNESEKAKEIEQLLLRSYTKAMQLYDWPDKSRIGNGILVEHSDLFGMEMGQATGVRVSDKLVESLLNVKKSSPKQVEAYLVGSFVHELAHRKRDEEIAFGGHPRQEIASHVAQFVTDPFNDVNFEDFITEQISKIESYRSKKSSNVGTYELGTYAAMVWLTDRLKEKVPAINDFLQNDPDSNKSNTLQSIQKLIRSNVSEEDWQGIRSELLNEILRFDGENEDLDRICEEVDSSEDRLGIKDKLSGSLRK